VFDVSPRNHKIVCLYDAFGDNIRYPCYFSARLKGIPAQSHVLLRADVGDENLRKLIETFMSRVFNLTCPHSPYSILLPMVL
jgi:hypothetical protein